MSLVLVGAALLGLTVLAIAYWDKVKQWIETILADRLEKVLGYGARKRLHHVVSIADKTARGIRNRVYVYIKKITGKGYEKMEEKRLDDISVVEEDIIKEIDEKGPIIQEFKYEE